MKTRFARATLLIALAATLLLASSALAAGRTQQYGPFPSSSPDSGTCGNLWATDTFDRFFRVDTQPGDDGTYQVVQEFKNGTFVTMAGASPGGCDTNPGGTVGAGITGKMQGLFAIVVSHGPSTQPLPAQSLPVGRLPGSLPPFSGQAPPMTFRLLNSTTMPEITGTGRMPRLTEAATRATSLEANGPASDDNNPSKAFWWVVLFNAM
jgi:hypothetical protein